MWRVNDEEERIHEKNQKVYQTISLSVFMLVYNSGVFAFLQTIGLQIKSALPEQVQLMVERLPGKYFAGEGVDTVRNLFVSSPFKWLLVSIVASIFLSFVGRLVRLVFSLVIIGVGLYLAYIYLLSYGYLS